MTMRAILFALAFLLAGCAPTTWQWSSDRGRQCFYLCQAHSDQCTSQCFGNFGCTMSCVSMRNNCLNACPDLQATQ
jgi:hypothetical protein